MGFSMRGMTLAVFFVLGGVRFLAAETGEIACATGWKDPLSTTAKVSVRAELLDDGLNPRLRFWLKNEANTTLTLTRTNFPGKPDTTTYRAVAIDEPNETVLDYRPLWYCTCSFGYLCLSPGEECSRDASFLSYFSTFSEWRRKSDVLVFWEYKLSLPESSQSIISSGKVLIEQSDRSVDESGVSL